MGRLAGRVAVVTGAGRGLGRSYALALAAEGAAVVVNDVDAGPAGDVVAEIESQGGRALASAEDVSDWEAARRIVDAAIATFGGLHILVNNAGVMPPVVLPTVTEAEWDRVMGINLKGHVATTRWAMGYWADRAARGETVQASVIGTTSIGAMATFGNAAYSASKGAVAQLGMVAALEGAKFGVRSNVIAPGGRTRLTLAQNGEERMTQTTGGFDFYDPDNMGPLIVYLALADCPVTGAVFHANGNQIGLFRQWPLAGTREAHGRWTVEALEAVMPDLLEGRLSMPSASATLADFMGLTARAKAVLEQPAP